MKISTCKSKSLGESFRLSTHQVTFVESDAANVLHSSIIMLRHKYLIVFPEWVGLSEHIFVKMHPALRNHKHLVKVHVVNY